MPSGQASHKGHSPKPNVNAPGIQDEAADLSQDPTELLPDELTNTANLRAESETVRNPAATQRPQTDGVEKPQDQDNEAQPE